MSPSAVTDYPFLQAIIAAPEDDAPRLVYADWLEEHGDAERAEFLRLLNELLKLPSSDERLPAIQERLRDLHLILDEHWLTLVREKRLVNVIRDAFRGVTLGEGVGLLQGQGLDDYADARTLAAYRARDEKQDWSAIPVGDLDRCYSSLSFFDAEGMRFHLPAYLCAHLQGALKTAYVLFHLVSFQYQGVERFENLSEAQRRAVREFLLLHLTNPYCEFERPMVEQALREFWTTSKTP